MSEAENKSNQIVKLQKRISEELNVVENDMKNIEKSKKKSVEKIEIKKIELKKFSNTQSVCDEHYATLQEIALTSKEIEERKNSITALDTTIANLDLQIAKIQSDHDKAVAELERKRRKLNDYLKYYEDLNDKLETLIKLLGEEELKHCIELNNLKIDRAKALARPDLSEDALNKVLKELDNKMTNLNVEHGILIDSISQKLSDITVDISVEEYLSEEKKIKKPPAATKKDKESITTKTGDEENVSEVGKKSEDGVEEDYKTEDAGDKQRHETDSDRERHKTDGDKERHKTDGDKERHKTDGDKESHKTAGDKQRHQTDGDKRDADGSKHGDERDDDADADVDVKDRKKLAKAKRKDVAKNIIDDIFSDEEFDEDLFDFMSEEKAKGKEPLTKDLRLEILRQGVQITPSNRIITMDDRVLTLQEAQRLGLLGAYNLDEAEEEGDDEIYDLFGEIYSKKGKKKKGKGKKGKEMEPVQYHESPASSESSLAKESSESLLCGRDNEYLKIIFGKSLTVALAEITAVQPADPIHYLAHWMLQYRYNQEIDQITRIQIQELMIEQERLAAEKWHRELQEEARLAVLEALFRAENIIIQQDYQSQLLQEYEGEYDAMSHVNPIVPTF